MRPALTSESRKLHTLAPICRVTSSSSVKPFMPSQASECTIPAILAGSILTVGVPIRSLGLQMGISRRLGGSRGMQMSWSPQSPSGRVLFSSRKIFLAYLAYVGTLPTPVPSTTSPLSKTFATSIIAKSRSPYVPQRNFCASSERCRSKQWASCELIRLRRSGVF